MQGREHVIEGFQLAPQQKRLWRLQQDSQAYYAQCAILMEGDIELGALEEALKKVLRKHEILRTTLDWFPGLETPIQLILENPPLPYRSVDLSEKKSVDIETLVADLLQEESRPFDLKRGLLVRFCLSQLSSSRQVLLISLHALCADGWTLRNLFKEIISIYAAELAGKELPDEPVQYLQFSEWQNELLEENSDEAQVKVREPVCSVTELMLPLESGRTETSESNRPTFSPESAAFTLDPRMTSRIEAFSDARGSSLSGFLLACWQILLWRLSAEEEIIIGCLYDGRQFDELHDALGLFARYLPVRGNFVRDLRFDETVDRAMISLRQAYLSQEFFLRDSASREAADRINAISFEYEEWPEARQVGPVRFSYWKQYFCLDRFKLKLGGYYKTEGLTIEIQYDPTVFSRESVELFQERYLRLIESAVEREGALTEDLEIIGRRELERLLVAWNRTEEKELDSDYLHELIAGQARLRPESIAVIYEEEQLSYGGLDSRANQLANRLRSLGVGPDCVVGLYLERSTEMIIGLLGILKAGAAYLPLEIGQPVERLLVMLEDAGARVIVTKPDVPGNLPLDGREVVMLYDGCQQIASQSREAPKVAVDPQNLAYVIYTSGSTGKPKGVMVRHGAVVNLWEWLKGAIYEGESAAPTVSLNAPLAFDASVKQVVQLGSGARLCIVPEEERVDAEFMLAYLRRNEVEVLDCTPSHLRMLVEAGLGEGESYPKVVLVGGEEIDRQSWEELSEGKWIKYYNVYGPTECTVDATACCVCVGMEPTIGRPIRNTQIYILDERGEVAPTGVVGDIYIGGAGLARGYLGAAGVTAEKFTPNPFGRRDGERLYRTGDLGRYLIDGRIAYEGRRDEQVKVRGHRIELGEIEEVLRSYHGVSGAVVTLREDELRQKRLVGYVVENTRGRTADLREEELRIYVRERVPGYMDLSAIIVIKELPLTKNGKVDRRALPQPEAVRSEDQIEGRRHGNAYEEIISGIWQEVLKVDPVRPGDNFFEIGGHSLLATQVISRVRNAFGVEIGVISIFQDATVEGLALRVEEAIKKGEKDAAPPLARVSREGSLPLSFAQQRLWFIDQLEPGNAIYNCPNAVRVEGHLNLEALERAINEIVRRHEALRTRIEVKEGRPAQVIDEWKYQRIEVEDLTSLSGEKREEEAGRIAREEAVTGFDLSRGPLLRVKALKLEEEQHVLLFTIHHIVGDGWSMGILTREVGELYRAYRVGEKSPLDELPIQYVDFAVWQRAWLKGAVLEAELEYWRNQLAGSEVLDLPTDYPRPAAPSYRGARRRFVVDRELARSLRSLSQREGVTLFMTLLAGFEILMSRYSGQADVSLGTDIANRNRAEVEGLIGFFVNQLVLRVEAPAAESVRELLKRVRAACLGAYAHQDVPFEKLVEELQPQRDLSRSPLFQVKLILQNVPGEDLELEGMRLRGFGGGGLQMAKLDMTLMLIEQGAELVGVAEYSRDLFEEETIARLMSHYVNVLMAIADDREKPIAELNLLSAAEREQIVVVWNKTARPFAQDRCVHELFAEQAERNSDRIALIHERDQVSYRELDRRANQLAHYLQGLGVGLEVVVGLCLKRSVEAVVALLGVLKAGGAYLPLDPESPLERLGYMLEDAGVGVALTDQELGNRLPSFWGQTVLLDEEWERIGAESESEPESEVIPGNLAYVIYTSGSTGRPKGVMVNHRGLANSTRARFDYYHDPVSSFLLVSPFVFDSSVAGLYWTLCQGGALVLPYEGLERDPAQLARLIAENGSSHLLCLPTLYSLLLSEIDPTQASSLKCVIVAGEACPTEVVEWHSEALVDVKLFNEYGPTECTVWSSVYGDCANQLRVLVPIGKPIANAQIYLLDHEREPAPVGTRGEIYISGMGLARGYVGRAELTGEKFIPNRFSAKGGERAYRTGDMGRYLSDGNIEFIGRADDQVKLRGYRIELGEIEAVLNERRSVRQSVVVARENERGEKRLIGYVVVEGEESASELKRYVRERLPEYMVPERIVTLEEIPTTANGKIDRKRLPIVEAVRDEGREEEAALSTPVEEIVAGIYEEVLKVERVGRRANFFEIGGHSLLATQVVSRVRNTFGVEMGVGSIFEAPTVEGLASKIDEVIKAGESAEAPPLVRVPREGEGSAKLPLSFAQQRLWFIVQMEPGNAVYNCPRRIRLEGRLDLEVLERVINEMVRRHEVLRTRIEEAEGAPVQVIDDWEPRRLEVEDLTGRTREEKEKEVRAVAKTEAETGFELSLGPLMRVKVLKLEEEEHVLLLTMHHIVSDAWSMGILIKEVGAIYRAYSASEPSPLPELPIQYADFAVWQRAWLQGEALERELIYWRKQLQGMEALELPMDHPRPAARSYRGASRPFVVESELTEKLRALGQREGATLYMTLLAGLDLLLSRYSGQEDISLGTNIANRDRAEIEGLIGFFVNQLVLRVTVKAKESFRELLKRAREVCLGAYAHQGVPFEKLVEELQPERDLGRSPLFQAKFIWENAQRERLELGDVRLSSVGGAETHTAKLDLTLAITDTGRALVGAVEYSRDLFEGETIGRLINHYTNVLSEIVSVALGEERAISEVSLLSEVERKQIVVEWNETSRPYPDDLYVHHLFTEQAKRNPERIALMNEGRQLSYGALDRRANQLARYLRRLGVGPEAVVGLCLERSVEMVVAVMGALKAGGAYLPLDPGYPLERVALMLEDAGVGVVLTRRELKDRLPAFWEQTVCLDQDWERIGEESESEPESGVVAENLAYVIYTSGSTGRPKGVMISHGGLSNYLQWARESYRIEEGEGAPVSSSIGFDLTVTSLYGPLVKGKCVNLLSEKEGIEALWRCLREESGYSLVKITPAHLELLAQQMSDCEVNGRANALVIGGEELRAKGLKFWQERARGTRLINEYGPTETVVGCCVYEVDGTESGREATPIGRPIANTRMYVLDEELEPAPVGVRGEIYISGVGVARGYLGKPELTGERFIPDGLGEAGVRAYRTGDVGRYLSDGNIEYVGRVDRQVKLRGYRIELGEIETALDDSRLVRRSVVEAVEDERGGKRLVGYVVGEEGATAAELKRHLRERLPEYMVPEAIVMLEEMPLSANGKVDRKRLPVIKDSGRQLDEEYVRARTPIEELVVGIFEDVLKLDGIGGADNFFEIGGHSLLATQVISRVRKSFGVEIGVRSIFEKPTVEGLANRIEEALRSGEVDEAPPLAPVGREGRGAARLPLSFAQQRLWFIDQLEPGNSIYNIAGMSMLEGRLDLKALERVINEIVRRHEVFRTRFEVEAGAPVQVIDEWEPQELEVKDLSLWSNEEKEAEVGRVAREEARTGFDLRNGPLLRVKVLKLEEERHAVLYTMHHIVSDGWSGKILITEISQLYESYARGEALSLPELAIQYADYAVWQREWLQGEVLEKLLAYWKRQLAGVPSLLTLPADRPRPAVQTYRGAFERFGLRRELSDELKRLSRNEGVTSFMTLLAGLQLLLARYSGEDRIAVGSPIAGRSRQETEGLIGFFVNTLVMVADVSGNPTVRELLQQVRERAIGAFAHQDLPFEKLVEELQPERSLSHQPLFQVLFAFQNYPEEPLAISGLKVGGGSIGAGNTDFDLMLTLVESGSRISGSLGYARDLYEKESILRLSGHLVRLLEGMASNRECRVLDIPLLTEEETAQVLECNQTAVEYATERCIHEMFEDQAELAPDRVAGINEGEQISYGELNRRANRLGNYLRRRGVGAEVRVGICLERGLEMLVGLLGILKAGGAYVPLDPAYPAERLAFMLEDAAVRLIVTQEKLKGISELTQTELICVDGDRGEILQEREENIDSGVNGENLAYIIYTSGSTGHPKGAMLAHQSVVNLITDAIDKFRLERDSKFFQFASLSFDVAVEEIFPALSIGGAVALQADNLLYSYSDLANTLERHEVTTVELPTIYWVEWMRELSKMRRRAPRSLNLVIIGGERTSPEILKEWREHEIPLLHVFGVTEVAVTSIVYQVHEDLGADPMFTEIPIGLPIANTEVYLLDGGLQQMPLRIPSEMYLGGIGLARGYLNRPDLTAARFVPSPFGEQSGSRLYKTGDLARYSADGYIEFVGRIDHQVKVRGYRVEMGEIEAALKSHPMTEETVVTAVKDGSGNNKLIAYVVPKYEYRHTIDQDGATVEGSKARATELWPAQGEYGIYDEVLYYAMTSDEVRNKSYKEAMRRLVRGKTVMDIGTGADAILSKLCIEAGARKVYAIEMREDSYQKAKKGIESEGLGDKIILIHGESTGVELPEKVDVCVSELIGTIGGAEGVVPILNDARRLLKDDGVMIPEKCLTKIAAVELPEEIRRDMAFTEVSGYYANKVFEKMGKVFDLRLCIRNFPKRNLISSVDLFEELEFKGDIEPEYTREICLRINRKARLEGLLLWINLEAVEGEVIDVLEYDGCWSPAYMPVFSPGIEVTEGDEIKASCSAIYGNNGWKPDYQVKGVVIRRSGKQIEFDYHSRLEERSYKGNEFYTKLFSDDGIRIKKNRKGRLFTKHLKNHLRETLPAHMMPSSFVVLDSLPLTAHGKVDRQRLPAPGKQDIEPGGMYVAPNTPIEKDVARICGEVLRFEDVGIYDDFFALGGHSLLVTQVINRINSDFQVELPVRALFDAPTVSGLVAAIVESQVGQTGDDVLSQMLAELEGLSEDEVDAILNG